MTGLAFRSRTTRLVAAGAVGVNTSIRAAWKGATSVPVQLRQAPRIQLDVREQGVFEVGVGSQGHMWRKKVVLQRRQGSSWVAVKQVVLTETQSTPGLGSGTWTEAEFRASVPAGSVVRAVLPIAEARPCYLAGVSNTLRT